MIEGENRDQKGNNFKEYHQRPETKQKMKAYCQRPEAKQKHKEYRESIERTCICGVKYSDAPFKAQQHYNTA